MSAPKIAEESAPASSGFALCLGMTMLADLADFGMLDLTEMLSSAPAPGLGRL